MKQTARSLSILILLILLTPACAKNGAEQVDALENGALSGGQESAEPEEKAPVAQTPADALAERVVAASGDPEALSLLAFSFVPQKDGEEVSRRHHAWQPQAGEVTITADEKEYKLTHLRDYDLTTLSQEPAKHADKWKEIAPELSPEDGAKAWGWFINDSYWLLMPTKLMDAGVNRELDEQGRLVLTFGEVGLTPGDRYTLTIDPETQRITRWEFKLQSGGEGDFDWSDYQEVGPLTLSGMRSARGSKMVISFDNLRAQP